MTGRINIEISFPIISFTMNDIYLSQTIKTYAIAKEAQIPQLNKIDEFVIDSDGELYKRKSIKFLNYINYINGFSLKFAGFGTCYLDIELDKIKTLSTIELFDYGIKILALNEDFYSDTTLPIQKWKIEFGSLSDREDILRYMFYFANTSYYYNPDKNDNKWRDRRGFINTR